MNGTFLYINLDGFGRYYYDAIGDKEDELPYLSQIIRDGVFFENAYTGIPSITYPMQSSIVSGGYSAVTGNCFQYLDRERNEIVLLRRHNRAQTIGELLREEGIPFVSIQQFTLEDRGCEYGNQEYLYVQPLGDYDVRFRMLCRLIRTGELRFHGRTYHFPRLPQAIFLYVDDLDTIGHNPAYFGAYDEPTRQENVVGHLRRIDQALGELIAALQEAGIYEETTLLLTTDHGMISYSGPSMVRPLADALRQCGLPRVHWQGPGKLPPQHFDAVLTSHDIQCQVYLNRPGVDSEEIAARLRSLPFVEQVLTQRQLQKRGVSSQYADLLVSPVEGAHFGVEEEKQSISALQATHDSLHEKCQHIFAVMKGPALPAGLTYTPTVYNIDFLPTLCRALGLPPLRDAAGRVLTDLLPNASTPQQLLEGRKT